MYTKHMKKKDIFKNVTLEELARMVAEGFEKTATKVDIAELGLAIDQLALDIEDLGDRIDRHMSDVRRQTDAIAHRAKKVEAAVFGVGK